MGSRSVPGPVREAQQIAQQRGLFVVSAKSPKGIVYKVFRRLPERNVYLGRRSSPEGLRAFVMACARVQ